MEVIYFSCGVRLDWNVVIVKEVFLKVSGIIIFQRIVNFKMRFLDV